MQRTWFGDWLAALGGRLWILLISVAGGVIPAIVTALAFGWPWYAWISVVLMGFLVASMLAYRQVWLEREIALEGKRQAVEDLKKALEDQRTNTRLTQQAISMEGEGIHSNVFEDFHISFGGEAAAAEPPDEEQKE